jgi:hypothetical protein
MTFKFELTEQEVQLVVSGLGKLQAETSFDLLSKVMRDVEVQVKEQEIKKKEEEDKLLEQKLKEYSKKKLK